MAMTDIRGIPLDRATRLSVVQYLHLVGNGMTPQWARVFMIAQWRRPESAAILATLKATEPGRETLVSEAAAWAMLGYPPPWLEAGTGQCRPAG